MERLNPKDVYPTIGKYMLADGMSQIIDLGKSHGSWLVDARDGKEYLDLFSMFASLSVGYNHPYILENKDRLINAALNKPTNSDVYSREMGEFVRTVGECAQPNYLPYAFFIEGGALAVENALKTAFDWKVRKNIQNGKKPLGSKVIHFNECFHGRTGYTLSLTDSPDKRKTLYFPKFDWPRITTPKLNFPLTQESLAETIKLEETALSQIKEAIRNHPDDIAAIIIEPIQGEGGDNHFREEFFSVLRTLADENEFLLIFDEVQTGVGITGKMWAHQHYIESAKPDVISFGKKTQVCGIFAGNRLNEVENHVFKESSRLNSTWGGNLVDMVRFSLYLEIIKKENLVFQAERSGAHLLNRLESLQDEFPEIVSNVRGKGLFCAFDLSDGQQRDTALRFIAEEGVLMLGCGLKSIRFRPHLNISNEEIDLGVERIRKALIKL